MHHKKLLLVILPLLLLITPMHCYYTYHKCTQLNFIPMPASIQCNLDDQQRYDVKDPCNLLYVVKGYGGQGGQGGDGGQAKDGVGHVLELIQDQQYKTFRCRTVNFGKSVEGQEQSKYEMVVEIEIEDPALKSAFTQKQQSYSLKITRNHTTLKSPHYVGFVRGLQTFLQSITCSKRYTSCYMTALPIQITDQPLFTYRGVLVDSSRHFIPIKLLEQTIDAMMYNKFNVFHWHIVDEDSFPLELKSHPELAQYASFSIYQRYTLEDVKGLIRYAMVRGVRVVPEIDTPGHAVSWAFAPQNADIACYKKKSLYQGPLDVTLHKTYQIVKQVFKQIFQLFPDPLVHLGGDEVQLNCLQNKTSFVLLQNIKQSQIQLHYRRKQKKMLKQLNSSKTFIYWMYDQITQIQSDDIMHWWGKTKLVPNVNDRKLILSSAKGTGEFYIDMGAGGRFGRPYHQYATWLDMYKINLGKEIQGMVNKDNILGCAITLWTEVSNIYTHHTKIWIRSSAMAERAWTDVEHEAKPDFLRRLSNHEQLMNRRGIPTAPATCEQCQINPHFC